MLRKNKQLLKEARKGHVERIDRLLTEGADVNCRGKYGYTPLMEAASQGHFETVRYLLDAGADPLIVAHDNAPPTFYACVRGYADVVGLLLQNGADPNAVRDSHFDLRPGDSRGVSLLHVAIHNGFDRIANALVDAGANAEHVTFGKTALEEAKDSGMTDVVENIRRACRARRGGRRGGTTGV